MLVKNESVRLKGTAIVLMVLLHLFNGSNAAACDTSVYVLGEPLVSQLVKFAGACVSLYLFLSGYGLFYIYRNKAEMGNLKRVFSLYVNFWIVFVVFISLGALLKPDVYPGSWQDLLANLTGWQTTYNGEWWFLFPYAVLALSSKYIFRWIDGHRFYTVVLVSGFMYALTYALIKRFGDVFFYSHWASYMPVLCLNCQFSFVMGAVFAKYDLFAYTTKYLRNLYGGG